MDAGWLYLLSGLVLGAAVILVPVFIKHALILCVGRRTTAPAPYVVI